jgi:hypothetical protein
MFTTLTFNLTNSAIRNETLQGRKYVVAPMVMLTEGVHNGSNGPLLYKEAECKRAVVAWNMKPIVVYHPEINGKGVSACDQDILEKQQVGMIMNTRWDGKLRAEAWIDENLATIVDDRVIAALEENKLMEVSTGLFIDNSGEPGEWNGAVYNAEAVNHQPDHLALLPDKIGACSIADGAGLLQLNEDAQSKGINVTRLLAREMDVLRRMVGNAMSHSNIHSALSRAIRELLNDKDHMIWIEDVYDDFFIYNKEDDKKLYKMAFSTSDTGVTISGEPVEVVRITEYRTPAGDFIGNSAAHAPGGKVPVLQNKRSVKMDKEKFVNDLIVNESTKWTVDDKDALMAMDEGVLEKMVPIANDEKPSIAQAPVDSVSITMEQYVNSAPAEFRDVLTNSLATYEATKQGLVEKIIANKTNKFTKEFLFTKGIGELQGIVALACNGEGKADSSDAVVPMFFGASIPATSLANNSEVVEEALDIPVMNFAS